MASDYKKLALRTLLFLIAVVMTNIFSSFPGHTPSLVPSESDVRRFTGAVPTASSDPVDFATRIVDNALSRGVSGSTPQALRDALPGIIAQNTHTMDSGISTLASRGDEPKYWAILGKPNRNGSSWDDGGYDENIMLWNSVRENPETSRIGNTLSNICGLNYYAELSQIMKHEESLVDRGRVSMLRKQFALDKHYIFDSARDYTRKWNRMGPIHRPGEGTMPSVSGSSGDRLVEYLYDGTGETNQLFSTQVRAGDYLHFVTSKIANPYNAFYLPNGRSSTARSGTAGEQLLQVRGFSSSELGYAPGDSSRGAGPLDDDVNYIELRRAEAASVAVRFDKLEWHDERGTFKVQNVAAMEGITEALNYLTSPEYEAYTEGHAEPVGIVIETANGAAPTQNMLDAAHRSPDALSRLQTVRYLAARKAI